MPERSLSPKSKGLPKVSELSDVRRLDVIHNKHTFGLRKETYVPGRARALIIGWVTTQ
jgi:hypothetical protein